MTYDPDLFRGAAAFYDRYRAPYAVAAIEFAVERLGLARASRIIDLGCGPGTLARRLAPHVAEVIAMDPDPDMLAEGRRLARSEGIDNITWMQAGSAELGGLKGPFRAAVMGQSFHWMDRGQVLGDFQRLIEDGGGIALINPGRRRPQESWEPISEEVVERYLGKQSPHPQRNAEPHHEPALRRSAFEITEDVEFSSTITRDIPSIIGFLYSRSDSTQRLFGERLDAFEHDLAAALRRVRPDGVFHETIETGVTVAMKRVG
ncbi:MAG TPA: class I SAM-dependent methyltransferase [Caulobacteraceae bacterium]|jgi:ubiquinone/menaquinone biosynthesis C-methylase UbiE|nr:class I SAM-dependent methyltransferase [Caulobacteraceae bacterium]